MWSSSIKTVLPIELTVPWEKEAEFASERKRLKYSALATECKEVGWQTIIYPVEVGRCSFVSTSAVHLLRDMGETGANQWKTLAEKADLAETSFWLWLRKKDKSWGNT